MVANEYPLFANIKTKKPLADEVRPVSFDDVYGQNHLIQKFRQMHPHNMILWGAPGTGKTTIARIIAAENKDKYHIESISAVVNNTNDIKQIFLNAIERKKQGIPTLLLVDEIHRFNKSVQDIFLPYIEDGTIILIGATTENPSFELNNALLSRCIVYTLNKLDKDSMAQILERTERISGKKFPLTQDAKNILFEISDGDARYLLNLCESLTEFKTEKLLSPEELLLFLQKRAFLYDKSGEGHYNLISALHKSIRGSDPNASLYWLYRMLEAGEDPHFILRRLMRAASEDIGIADPNAIRQVVAAREAYDFLGSPEGELCIAQATVYLATAPKSNAIYMAEKKVKQCTKRFGSLSPPKHILNAPTKLMKEQGYSKGYIYDHDTEHCFSGQNYFPETISSNDTSFYVPSKRGFEKNITERMEHWQKLKKYFKE